MAKEITEFSGIEIEERQPKIYRVTADGRGVIGWVSISPAGRWRGVDPDDRLQLIHHDFQVVVFALIRWAGIQAKTRDYGGAKPDPAHDADPDLLTAMEDLLYQITINNYKDVHGHRMRDSQAVHDAMATVAKAKGDKTYCPYCRNTRVRQFDTNRSVPCPECSQGDIDGQ